VVTDTFDDGNSTGIANGKAFTGDTTEIALTFYGTIKNGIADND